jgi:D-alanyl-D-alanine carboxypeptidase (penicillin-binding protein 5/6)
MTIFPLTPKNKVYAKANNSSSEIVMEVNSKRILYQNNARDKKYMASTTKILTAIVIIENCDLTDIVTVTKDTVGIEGSSIYLEEGEKITVNDLLYGLMLRSGNDCAETLAVHCSGTIKKFAEIMNEKAREIGALNSNFVNPHGLHDDNHYTTAYDLALISCYAIKNPTFKKIVSTKSTKISFSTRDYVRHITNKNKMLKEFDGATGIKTGYTKKAGRCLVTSCERNGLELVSVVLNCPPMFERSKNILNHGFANYKTYKLVESDNIIDFIIDKKTNNKIGVHIKKDIVLPLTQNEYKKIKITYEYPTEINFDIKNDQEIGIIKIYCENNLIFTEKIYTIL